MTQRPYLRCKLCGGEGYLPPRSSLDDAMECPDCEGAGEVKRGSPEHELQSRVKYRRKHQDDAS